MAIIKKKIHELDPAVEALNEESLIPADLIISESTYKTTYKTLSEFRKSLLGYIEVEYTEALNSAINGDLLVGAHYYITDRDYVLTAINEKVFSPNGLRVMPQPKYGDFDNYVGTYRNSVIYNTGEYVNWGGKIWRWAELSPGNAKPINSLELGAGWELIPTTNTDIYSFDLFEIKYNIYKDWVYEQRDYRGNIIGCPEKIYLETLAPSIPVNPVDCTDYRKIYGNTSYIVLNNYGDVHSNSVNFIIENVHALIAYNDCYVISDNQTNNEKSSITYNKTFAILRNVCGDIINNNGESILSNYANSIIDNNTISISNNTVLGDISNNIVTKIFNNNVGTIDNNVGGRIYANTDCNIISNNRVTEIAFNEHIYSITQNTGYIITSNTGDNINIVHITNNFVSNISSNHLISVQIAFNHCENIVYNESVGNITNNHCRYINYNVSIRLVENNYGVLIEGNILGSNSQIMFNNVTHICRNSTLGADHDIKYNNFLGTVGDLSVLITRAASVIGTLPDGTVGAAPYTI